MRQSINMSMLLSSALLLSVRASEQRQVPITIEVRPAAVVLKSGTPLLLQVTISNGLSREIRFQTFSLSPNSWLPNKKFGELAKQDSDGRVGAWGRPDQLAR
jgi:hypothetical protein